MTTAPPETFTGWYKLPGSRWQEGPSSPDEGECLALLRRLVHGLRDGRHAEMVVLPAGRRPWLKGGTVR